MPDSVNNSISSEMGEQSQSTVEGASSYLRDTLGQRSQAVTNASYDRKQFNQEAIKGLNAKTKDATPKEMVEMLKVLKDLRKEQKQSYKERKDQITKQYKDDETTRTILLKQLEEEENGNDEMLQKMSTQIGVNNLMVKGLENIAASMTASFKDVIETNNANRNAINTRLQGIQNQQGVWYNEQDKWSKLQSSITTKFGMSMIVNERDILTNIRKAVDQGIANNIEQRAMLATLAENIATTFDAFSAELTRYIRLSQQDNTTLMMGMETSLNTLLNKWFSDTSYLNNNRTASISGQLMEAMSQMDSITASQFNFTVQKWLGSLYSLGMSDSAISALAGAIGQVYSGNVSGINENMQNLMAMSAARSGQSYADILTRGINGSDVNSLMQSMVEYLAEIADGTNNVVKTAHGSIFGMSISDLRSASNLLGSIETVSGQDTSAQTMLSQTASMIGTIDKRLGLSGLMNNLIKNFKYTTAANIVGTGLGQSIYEIITDMGQVIDTAIPFITAAGFGIDLHAKVTDLIQAGLGGLSVISGIGTLISGLSNGAAFTNLDESLWNTTGLSASGTGLGGIGTGGGSGTSRKAVAGGGDIAGMEVTDAQRNALSTQGYDEGATKAPEKNTDDVFYEIESLHAEITKLLNEINGNLFGTNGTRKPILVDINSLPSGIVVGEKAEQSLKVSVTNGEIERIPVEIGGGFAEGITSGLANIFSVGQGD